MGEALVYWVLGLAQGCTLAPLFWVTLPIVWEYLAALPARLRQGLEEVWGWKQRNAVTHGRSAKT